LRGTVRKKITEMPYAKQIAVGPGQVVADLRDRQGLRRLAMDPKNANALMALYESHEFEIRAAAVRHFGKNQLAKKAVLNLLVAVVSRAWSYDPQSMNTSEWVSRVADAEARRLREALDAGNDRGRRARRPI